MTNSATTTSSSSSSFSKFTSAIVTITTLVAIALAFQLADARISKMMGSHVGAQSRSGWKLKNGDFQNITLGGDCYGNDPAFLYCFNEFDYTYARCEPRTNKWRPLVCEELGDVIVYECPDNFGAPLCSLEPDVMFGTTAGPCAVTMTTTRGSSTLTNLYTLSMTCSFTPTACPTTTRSNTVVTTSNTATTVVYSCTQSTVFVPIPVLVPSTAGTVTVTVT